jgi:hypothetical protein
VQRAKSGFNKRFLVVAAHTALPAADIVAAVEVTERIAAAVFVVDAALAYRTQLKRGSWEMVGSRALVDDAGAGRSW